MKSLYSFSTNPLTLSLSLSLRLQSSLKYLKTHPVGYNCPNSLVSRHLIKIIKSISRSLTLFFSCDSLLYVLILYAKLLSQSSNKIFLKLLDWTIKIRSSPKARVSSLRDQNQFMNIRKHIKNIINNYNWIKPSNHLQSKDFYRLHDQTIT